MIRRPAPKLALAACTALTPALALADVPRVAADIAPIHSLVAMVMGDLGAPDLILPATADPHSYALRPSEAAALQAADIVVWVGPDLTPWMADPIETLADDAAHLTLLDVPGISLLDFREDADFAPHDHGDHDDHDHDDHDNHAHDDHDHDHDHDRDHDDHAHDDHDHDHDDHAHDDHNHDHDHDAHAHDAHAHDAHAHDDHDHDDDHGHSGHDHAHGAHDPHAWLDPANAQVWLTAIADALSQADPENAETYAANAAAAGDTLAGLTAEVSGQMAAGDTGFFVFHDAYRYFETRFGITASGSISPSDASDPSPARVAELRERMEAGGIGCVFAEPQHNTALIENVFLEDGIHLGILDPIGVDLTPGPELYPSLIRAMADSFAACFDS